MHENRWGEMNLFTLCFFSLVLLVGAAYVHIQYLEPYFATQGFSALDFANSVLYPEHFVKDYPGGSGSIKNSILPWIYPVLMKNGLPFHWIYDVMVFLEVSTLCMGACCLLRTLFPDASYYSYLILMSLLTLSWIRAGNLANFGNPFFHGQFYGFADGLSLLATALMLQKRQIFSLLIFMLSFMIHPIITVCTLAFMAGIQLMSRASRKELQHLLFYLIAFIAFAAAWYLRLTHATHEVMTKEEFFGYSYLCNFHWFPQDLKLFTQNNGQYGSAFFAGFLFAAATVARMQHLAMKKIAFLAGLFALFVLALLGCAFAYFEISPTLVKACFQRASVVALTLTTILISYQIVWDYSKKNYLYCVLSGFCLFNAYLTHIAWFAVPVIIYALNTYLDLRNSNIPKKLGYKDKMVKEILLSLLIAYLLYQVYLLAAGFTTFYFYASQLKRCILGGAIAGLTLFALTCIEKKILNRRILNFIVFISFFSYLNGFWIYHFLPQDKTYDAKNEDYKQVQLWALRATPKTALFMVDPSHVYGWRDFSKRSSVGTPSEWLNSAWLYSSDRNVFLDGVERTLMLADDNHIIPVAHSSNNQQLMNHIVRQSLINFYRKDGRILQRMVGKYGIDYIVFDKDNAREFGELPEWNKVYENQSFVVLNPHFPAK